MKDANTSLGKEKKEGKGRQDAFLFPTISSAQKFNSNQAENGRQFSIFYVEREPSQYKYLLKIRLEYFSLLHIKKCG